MDVYEAMRARHSVRRYLDRPIEAAAKAALQQEIDACNAESGLHIQLVTDEPGAFSGAMARYGSFSGVANYIAIVGKRGAALSELAGCYGERVALSAQMLGLNTCWVALTFSKRKAKYVTAPGEKLVCVLSLGYGATQGVPHKNRPLEALYRAEGPLPDWFRAGLDAALLAPTATNQQRFRFTLQEGNRVLAEATGGPYATLDLGIVKYHFELGAGKERFVWA